MAFKGFERSRRCRARTLPLRSNVGCDSLFIFPPFFGGFLAATVSPFAAHVRFVHFDFAGEFADVFG